MKDILTIIFKYVIDGKQIVIKRNDDNKITGYSFKSINYDKLMQDTELVSIIEANKVDAKFNIRHNRQGNTWLDANKVEQPVYRSFFYVGMDTRVDYTSAEDLLNVE